MFQWKVSQMASEVPGNARMDAVYESAVGSLEIADC